MSLEKLKVTEFQDNIMHNRNVVILDETGQKREKSVSKRQLLYNLSASGAFLPEGLDIPVEIKKQAEIASSKSLDGLVIGKKRRNSSADLRVSGKASGSNDDKRSLCAMSMKDGMTKKKAPLPSVVPQMSCHPSMELYDSIAAGNNKSTSSCGEFKGSTSHYSNDLPEHHNNNMDNNNIKINNADRNHKKSSLELNQSSRNVNQNPQTIVSAESPGPVYEYVSDISMSVPNFVVTESADIELRNRGTQSQKQFNLNNNNNNNKNNNNTNNNNNNNNYNFNANNNNNNINNNNNNNNNNYNYNNNYSNHNDGRSLDSIDDSIIIVEHHEIPDAERNRFNSHEQQQQQQPEHRSTNRDTKKKIEIQNFEDRQVCSVASFSSDLKEVLYEGLNETRASIYSFQSEKMAQQQQQQQQQRNLDLRYSNHNVTQSDLPSGTVPPPLPPRSHSHNGSSNNESNVNNSHHARFATQRSYNPPRGETHSAAKVMHSQVSCNPSMQHQPDFNRQESMNLTGFTNAPRGKSAMTSPTNSRLPGRTPPPPTLGNGLHGSKSASQNNFLSLNKNHNNHSSNNNNKIDNQGRTLRSQHSMPNINHQHYQQPPPPPPPPPQQHQQQRDYNGYWDEQNSYANQQPTPQQPQSQRRNSSATCVVIPPGGGPPPLPSSKGLGFQSQRSIREANDPTFEHNLQVTYQLNCEDQKGMRTRRQSLY
eukprot:Awhi_evm1s15263